MPVPGYPLATDKANDTAEVNDHPPHHNALATGVNWLSDAVGTLQTSDTSQGGRITTLETAVGTLQTSDTSQGSRITTLETASVAPPMPVGRWFPAYAFTSTASLYTIPVGEMYLTRVLAPRFDALGTWVSTTSATEQLTPVVYNTAADGQPGTLRVAGTAVIPTTGGQLQAPLGVTVPKGDYWVGFLALVNGGGAFTRGLGHNPWVPPKDNVLSNNLWAGYTFSGLASPPSTPATPTTVFTAGTGGPVVWLRGAP